ncbi:SDR family NAD(P)-dependent oxidoreductase [Mesorhizobium kowhaii]|uniref:Short-chain dehydrogenase n=1 Tax=Mesorhizobium kowhaii TaxID=1300272 RepID=A0A2W7C8Y1_9HYPH|nr:SDR family oxidoreductase [Mesorhizobium kowhaii]PZV38791.1 short-chain dehydrogenase [Mesorhizobium kowhaii]
MANRTHEGRIAIVTGAAQGIGREISLQLAARGAKLALVDLRKPVETAELIGNGAIAIQADISVDSGWAELAATVDKQLGEADIVVNNAGIYPNITIDELDLEAWRRTFAVNLDSHFYSAKHFVPRMRKKKWGRFVNLSSNSIGLPITGLSHYMAAKMGVIGFVRGLANDVAADGITVNAILPALTNTPGTSGVPEEFKKNIWEGQAIKRFAEPADIAGPILFLTSDDARFMTGQALVVDGGQYKIS